MPSDGAGLVFDVTPDLLGGVNAFQSAEMIGHNQSADLTNIFPFLRGTLRRRGGSVRVIQVDTAASSKFQPVYLGAFNHRTCGPLLAALVNRTSGSSRLVIADNETQTPIDFTAGHQFSDEAEIVHFADRLYILDPGFQPQFWEPAVAELQNDPGNVTAMPQGSTGAFFKWRGYVAGVPDQPKALFFSLLLGNVNSDADLERTGQFDAKIFDWHPDQMFLVETGNIVAVRPYHNLALVVFTDRGIEMFEPDNCAILNSTLTTVSRGLGCGSRHTTAICGEELVFMDHEGHIRSLAQSLTDEPLGITKEPLSKPISTVVSRVNQRALRAARAAFWDGVYWISWPVDGSLTANETWGFSIKDRAWSGPYRFRQDVGGGVFSRYGVGGLAAQRFVQDKAKLYLLARASDDSAQILRIMDPAVRTDDGLLIPVQATTRAFNCGHPEREKEFQSIELHARFLDDTNDTAVTITGAARVDEGDWTAVTFESFAPNATLKINESAGTPVINESAGTPIVQGYGVQHVRSQTTGLGLGHSLQVRLDIRESAATYEILEILVTGIMDNVKFASTG